MGMKTTVSFIIQVLCKSIHSVVHAVYSSLSATTDWIWGAPSILWNGYSVTVVGAYWVVCGFGHSPKVSTEVKESV